MSDKNQNNKIHQDEVSEQNLLFDCAQNMINEMRKITGAKDCMDDTEAKEYEEALRLISIYKERKKSNGRYK